MDSLKDWIERSDPGEIRVYDWIISNLRRSADEGLIPEFIIESFVKDVRFDGTTMTFIFTDGRELEISFSDASEGGSGLMSKEDKERLDSLWSNLGNKKVVATIKEPDPEDPNEFIMRERSLKFSIDPSKLSNDNIPSEVAVAKLLNDMAKEFFGNVRYEQKPGAGNENLMEMKFYNTNDELLSTIELAKENFLSSVRKYSATQSDVDAGYAQAVGDPILEFTLTNGESIRIDLIELVDNYSGNETDSISVNINDYVITADLKISSSRGNVLLSVVNDGLLAQMQMINSESVKLSNTDNGELKADVIIDSNRNSANQTLLNISEDGLYSINLWNDSSILRMKYYKDSASFVSDKTANLIEDGDVCFIGSPLMIYAFGKYWDGTQNFVDSEVKRKIDKIVDYLKDISINSNEDSVTITLTDYNPNTDSSYDRIVDFPIADASRSGAMTASDFDKLVNIESGAQVNTVNSVAGKVGDVLLNKSDVGLDRVDNTNDLEKPISNATQKALDLKSDRKTTYTKTEVDDIINALDKYSVKLDQVDNTSDINKPVSSATRVELDLKSDKENTYTKADVNGIIESLDKHSVKLPNVDNTADIEKPVSRPQQQALDLKADKSNTYTKEEVDNKISQGVQSLHWKETVATYDDIRTHYPNPEDGWTVNVADTDITYRYDGQGEWIPISSNSIPLATQSVDGKMSKEDKKKLDGLNEDNVHSFIISSDNSKAIFTILRDSKYGTEELSEDISFPVSSSTNAGTMSSEDKIKIDRIESINNSISSESSETGVTIKLSGKNISSNEATLSSTVILPATSGNSGVMSPSDKTKLDNINYVGTRLSGSPKESSIDIILSRTNSSTGEFDESVYSIPQATSDTSGVMSSSDKTKLEEINSRTSFSKVKVGESEINSTSHNDEINIVSGDNINIEADPISKSITVHNTYELTEVDPSIVTQDSTHRFVSDEKINYWDSKSNNDHTHYSLSPKLLDLNSNLNLVTQPGLYYTNDDVVSTILNKPVEENISLAVSGKESVLFQVATSKSGMIYTRNIVSGTVWTDWKEYNIDSKADLSYVNEKLSGKVDYFNGKSLLLELGQKLVGTYTDSVKGTTDGAVLAMVNDWNIADFGSSKIPLNLNSSVRPTIQLPGVSGEDAEGIAYVSEVNELSNKLSNTYTKEEVDRIVGSAHESEVTSVNGLVGDVKIGKSEVGLGQVDNTPDSEKPVSRIQQLSLDLKADKSYVDAELSKKISSSDVATTGSNGLMSAGDKAALDSMIGLNGVSVTTIINDDTSDKKVPSEKLFKSEIDKIHPIDNLTSSSVDSPLSANQGMVLDSKLNNSTIKEIHISSIDSGVRLDVTKFNYKTGSEDVVPSNLPMASDSSNGFMTKEDKIKLDTIENGAQVNRIENIKVNGLAQEIGSDDKSVNIDLSGYSTKEDIKDSVKYQNFVYDGQARKTIQLPNYDSISSVMTDGTGVNVLMVNKWDVVDLGSPKLPINLNTPSGIRPTVQEPGQSGEEAFKIAYVSDFDSYSSKSDLSSVISRLSVLEDRVSNLNKTNIEPISISGISPEGLDDSTKDYVISGTVDSGASLLVSGRSASLSNVSISNNVRTKVSVEKDVELKDVNVSGDFPKSSGNSVININNDGYVVIKDTVFNSTLYNAIEIGLSSDHLPKGVLIDNCEFRGEFSNNAILIFGTQDNSVININNCYFENVSNCIRLSNKNNSNNVVVNITNCKCDKWDVTSPWQGFLICQDYTSGSIKSEESNNLFSKDKITINISNLTKPDGSKLTNPQDLSSICGTSDSNQIFYVWNSKGELIPYGDGSRYPSINIF